MDRELKNAIRESISNTITKFNKESKSLSAREILEEGVDEICDLIIECELKSMGGEPEEDDLDYDPKDDFEDLIDNEDE